MKILIDMDGVVVDFWGGIVKAHGLEIDPYDLPRWKGHYGGYDVLGITPEAFWAPCDESWWFGLQPMPDYRELIDFVEREVGPENVCLLTSPSLNVGCPAGKLRWIDKHLPAYRRKVLIGPAKEFCAHPGSLLIDDMEGNCRKFQSHGGRAILYPGPWNRLHESSGRGLDFVKTRFSGGVPERRSTE